MKNIEQNTMLKFDEALERVLSLAEPVGAERVGISQALNRVLAEDVVSDVDIPPFNKSAMDGFACRRADLGVELAVIETIPAGGVPEKKIGKNECAKIMTGAMVPGGADCVIMVEFTEKVGEDKIRFTGKDTAGNICFKAEDVRAGDVVLPKATRIKPQHIAILATAGCVKPLVALRPAVGIVATGDELVDPADKPGRSQIRNSNSLQLAAQVQNAGATPTNYGIAKDTPEAIDGIFKKAISENDVVIVSGGVSVGEFDLVPEILKKNRVNLLFEKVAIKPGKPTVFGIFEHRLPYVASAKEGASPARRSFSEGGSIEHRRFIFGLPGNPVSTFIIFEIFIKPFLYKLMGCEFAATMAAARLAKSIKRKKAGRDSWLPVAFSKDGRVTPAEYHGSAHINALCEADGLICVPAGVSELKEGTTVYVRRI